MPERDLGLLIDTAHEAGRIARRYWKRAPKTWEKAGAGGPVSEADLAVNEMLHDRLMAAHPDHGWLSEESPDNILRQGRSRVFIVDPIDGTRAFLAGERTWSHSLALAVDGTVVAAVVYLPILDKTYAAALGGGAALNGARLAAGSRSRIGGAEVLSNSAGLEPGHWPGGVPPVRRAFRPSLAYRMSLVAEGRYDAMVSMRDTWEWDVAAGTLIATEAGARVSDSHGAQVLFNNPRPALPGIVAAGPALHTALMAYRSPAGA